MTDPATWREAARQLREEADTWHHSAPQVRDALRSLARRFENEATASEKQKEQTP